MPDNPEVAHGDRRDKVWIEESAGQVSKVRHTWPAEGPLHEQSEAREKGDPARHADVTDTAVVPEDPSAWEARED